MLGGARLGGENMARSITGMGRRADHAASKRHSSPFTNREDVQQMATNWWESDSNSFQIQLIFKMLVGLQLTV